MLRQYLKLILCGAAALLTWAVLPGTSIDRGLFTLTVRAFGDPPFFITGNGSRESAHTLRTLKRHATQTTDTLPEVTITDDPSRVFQTSPPSPVDFAIILKNLRRLGRESIAIGMPLAWPEPDVISLMALDQQLDALTTLVTAAPLSRGPIPSPIPPAFRRASVAVKEIHGNARNLAIVNRVSIPDILLGNTTSQAGFTALDSEPVGGPPHLLARWDDRVVLSFTLLAALADQEISPAKIDIHMGKFISLGETGPFIPIDEFGRLAFSPPRSETSASIPAESLIDAPDDFLTGMRTGTILIRNDMSAVDENSLLFSEYVVTTASLIADSRDSSTSRVFLRMPPLAEILLITSLISLLHSLGNFPKTNHRYALLALTGIFLILHFILVPTTDIWPPTLPALAAVLTAIPLTTRRLLVVTKDAQPAQPPHPQSRTATRKTAAKKTPRKRNS